MENTYSARLDFEEILKALRESSTSFDRLREVVAASSAYLNDQQDILKAQKKHDEIENLIQILKFGTHKESIKDRVIQDSELLFNEVALCHKTLEAFSNLLSRAQELKIDDLTSEDKQLIWVNTIKLETLRQQLDLGRKHLDLLKSFLGGPYEQMNSYTLLRGVIDNELKGGDGIFKRLQNAVEFKRNKQQLKLDLILWLFFLSLISYLSNKHSFYIPINTLTELHQTEVPNPLSITQAMENLTNQLGMIGGFFAAIIEIFLVLGVASITFCFSVAIKKDLQNTFVAFVGLYLGFHVCLLIHNGFKHIFNYLNSKTEITREHIVFNLPNIPYSEHFFIGLAVIMLVKFIRTESYFYKKNQILADLGVEFRKHKAD